LQINREDIQPLNGQHLQNDGQNVMLKIWMT